MQVPFGAFLFAPFRAFIRRGIAPKVLFIADDLGEHTEAEREPEGLARDRHEVGARHRSPPPYHFVKDAKRHAQRDHEDHRRHDLTHRQIALTAIIPSSSTKKNPKAATPVTRTSELLDACCA